MSLYNTYRPRDWDSVIGQEYITTILRNSLTTGRVHHAYLFHGSRGTGKTTSARILAKALNCLDQKNGNPCHECGNCRAFDNDSLLDIIEIDGASNNGVDDVRELIERARFEPNQAPYKIYIIDEVHMLTTGAFNALLKTLEQPPKHVKFILATTEIDKVPETIRSRALRFDFRKIGQEDIIHRLEYVCKTEGVQAESEALTIIAKSARGGLRDALTLLEQNIIDGEISTEHVRYTLALVEESMIDGCIEALKSGDIGQVQDMIEVLKSRHVEARAFFEQMMYRLRDMMIEHIRDAEFFVYSEIFGLFESAYGRIRSIPDGMMLIEITLLRIAKRDDMANPREHAHPKDHKSPPLEKPTPPLPKESAKDIAQKNEEKSSPNPEILQEIPKEIKKIPIEIPTPSSTIAFSYPHLINSIKESQGALSTDLKMARFQTEGTTLTLNFSKKWNYDRVNTFEKKNIIAEVIMKLYGESWTIECKLSEGSEGLSAAVHEIF